MRGNYLLNTWQSFNHNDPLSVLPGNKRDLGHENIVNMYVFYQIYKVHDIVCFGDQSAMQRSHDTLVSDIS